MLVPLKMKHLLGDIVLLCITFCVTHSSNFPSYIQRCHRHDPKLSECVRRAITSMQDNHLGNGIPELLIPPLDPLVVPYVSLNNQQGFRASFENLEIYHTDEFILDDINFDLDKNHVDMSLTFPKLSIIGEYDIDGNILILKLKGHGPASGNYTNVHADINVELERYTKEGNEHLKITGWDVKLDIGKPVLRFENLFGDNEELNEQTNKVINDNIEDIVEDLRPVVTDVISQIAGGLINRLFGKFSIDELFPQETI